MAIMTADALVEQYRVEQAKIAGKAASAIDAAFKGFLDPNNLDKSFPAYKAAAEQVTQFYRGEAAALGGGFYLAHREAMGVFDRVPTVAFQNRVNPTSLGVSLLVTGPVTVKKALSQGASLEQALGAAETRTAGAVYRQVANGGRQTIASTVMRDKKALGFARVTDGRPCYFCAMLASRGAVYKTEETALLANGVSKYHDHCGCFVVPTYDGSDPWPGMGPEFREIWDSTRGQSGSGNALEFRRLYEERFPKGTNPSANLTEALVSKAKSAEEALLATLANSADAELEALKKTWEGKPFPKSPGPEPQAPIPGKPTAADWQPWIDGVQTRYEASPVYKGKPIQSSNNWSQFQSAMDGDAAALKFLTDNFYIDGALAKQAQRIIKDSAVLSPEQKAAYKSAMHKWRNNSTRYDRYVKEWERVNGPRPIMLNGFEGDVLDWDTASSGGKAYSGDGPLWAKANLPAIDAAARRDLKGYTGSDSTQWNTELREQRLSYYADATKRVDAAMTPLPRDVVVRRGTEFVEFEFPGGVRTGYIPPPDPRDLIGSVQVQRGYWSTSIDTSAAFSSRTVQMEIRLPAGTPVVDAMRFSNYGAGERELVVGRDTNFFIHDIYREGGHWVMEVEVLPPGVDPALFVGQTPRPRPTDGKTGAYRRPGRYVTPSAQ